MNANDRTEMDLLLWRATLDAQDTVPYDVDRLIAQRRREQAQRHLSATDGHLARARRHLAAVLEVA